MPTAMGEPSKQLQKVAHKLFADAGDRTAFIQALTQPLPFAPTLVWTRPQPTQLDWKTLPPLPWQPASVDRLVGDVQPGKSPLHDAGYFYCLDFSSVFAVSLIQALPDNLDTVIDLCAAPGGKSVCAWAIAHPRRLLCNEVIRKRVKILIANLKRCDLMDAVILNQDTSVLAENLPQCADLVLVDAPCSGQSLLAKGQSVDGCFHKVTLNRNANRQKRILANATHLVRSQGYLLYSTCTYSPEENERVCQWLIKTFPQFEPVAIEALHPYQSHLTDLPCYRLWPQSGLGAGAFAMLLQRRDQGQMHPINEAFLDAKQRPLYRDRPPAQNISPISKTYSPSQ
jgi:16S rRNA C967 or C1407 C5-methylase (RsmB/RsmF family)